MMRLILVSLLSFLYSGCGLVVCGEGTYQVGNECRAPDGVQHVKCGAGFDVVGSECVPGADWARTICDPATTTYDPISGTCMGTGEATPCSHQKFRCDTAGSGTLCISGRVFQLDLLLAKGDEATPVPLITSGLVVRTYDPLTFDPTALAPTASATFQDDAGCFVVPSVPLSLSGAIFIGVDSGQNAYATTMTGYETKAKTTLTNVVVAAVPRALEATWTAEVGGESIESEGAMIIQFRSPLGFIEGMIPLQGGKEPGDWAKGELHYFNDDVLAAPHFSEQATSTSRSGAILVKGAPVAMWGAQKGAACKLPGMLYGSSPGGIIFGIRDVLDHNCQ